MAKSRISFPFSFLLSSTRSTHGTSTPRPLFARYSSAHPRPTPPTNRPLTYSQFSTATSSREAPETATGQRYGTANQPPPHLNKQPEPASSTVNVPEKISQTTALAKGDATIQEIRQEGKVSESTPSEQASTQHDQVEGLEETAGASELATQNKDAPSPPDAAQTVASDLGHPDDSALKTILGMDSPMSGRAEKPPHLEPPPYTHHFDTYTLVRSLEEGGFSEEEAVILMKAVRAILADNMDLARDGLVSKGDAEMSAYMFRSACSELRTELSNNRKSMTERMQSERNTLQHEVDVLSQRITAETSSLKDELKGMFDDRKMAVRMERRDLENQIQEVNYSITTRLNSEMKSEAESLRWVLVRRTAISIAIVTATALLTLKIMQTAEKRRETAEAASASKELSYDLPEGTGG